MFPVEAFATRIKVESSKQHFTFRNSEQLIPTNQHILSDTKEAWQCFCPLNPFNIKQSRAPEGNDQAIRDNFLRSRFLILVANASVVNI